VNEDLPIALSWSPQGFAGWYQLQIAANPDFANPLLDVPFQNDAFYVWTNAVANDTYYYRVKTWNEAGASDWSVGSFETAPPNIQVTNPSSGNAWIRGSSYFIQWNDNLGENVAIELYNAGTLSKTISSNAPSTGAYKWQVGFDLTPGSDYSIKIRSVTNTLLSASTTTTFTIIDSPTIDMKSIMRLPDGKLRLGFSIPGAVQATLLVSTNLVSWGDFQTTPLTNGSAVLWDDAAPNFPVRFYRIRVP